MTEKIYTRDYYGKALVDLGKERQDIVVLDADLSGSTRTSMFAKEFPDRFFNVGVAEQNLMGISAGIASCGFTVFASSFAMFATGRPWDQIRNTIAANRLNVKICATHAGITVGEDGASHQANEDIAIMRAIPNMRVIVPCDAYETYEAVKAIAQIDGPFYLRMGRSKFPVIPNRLPFEFGKGQVIERGKDVCIVACGIMVSVAFEAVAILREKGISPTLVNMPTIKPIDKDLLLELTKGHNLFITCEEHSIIGGLGSAVCEALSEVQGVTIKRLGIPDTFGQSGTPDELMRHYGLTVENIVSFATEG